MYKRGILVRNLANPQLGPGRVRSLSEGGILVVRFAWKDTDGHFDPNRSSLERYELYGHTPVQCKPEGFATPVRGIVLERSNDDGEAGIYHYRVKVRAGDDILEVNIPETQLFPLPPKFNDPLDILKSLAWQGPEHFFRRWRMRLQESRWIEDSGGITAFLGARVQPMGHQLYAARRVLWDRVPRFILADEVGLGKTIEAGLVIQALKAENPDLSVLIVAPGSMARQWQMELYLRFGAQAYGHVDSATFAGASGAARKRILDGSNLVVTTTALHRFQEISKALTRRRWDLVVVDEAHQYPPNSPLYDFFYQLARESHGFLALSATPSKREITSLAGLLALVAPDAYAPTDEDGLSRRLAVQREVWDRLTFTRKYLDAISKEGRGLQPDDFEFLAEDWEALLENDPVVEAIVSDLKVGHADAPDKLVAYVQEFHRLDHRIIRTRRSALQQKRQHWSIREVSILDYEPDTYEAVLANHLEELPLPKDLSPGQLVLRGLYYRFFASSPTRLAHVLEIRSAAISRTGSASTVADPLSLLTADPGPADEELLLLDTLQSTPAFMGEIPWLESAIGLARTWCEQSTVCRRTRAVCAWLMKHLDEAPDNQVLLFAQDRLVVEELTGVLRSEMTDIPVHAFHHGMDEVDLAQVSLQFQRNQGCRVLVSDELGGEGRNFQNASAVLHFDLPWSVARLEQRVGRLDRVGRDSERPVESVVMLGPTATESALFGIHEEVFHVFTRSVGGLEYALPRMQREINEAVCHGPVALKSLIVPLSQRVDEELHDVDEAFELSLDASKHQLDAAEELADWLNDSDRDPVVAKTVTEWARESRHRCAIARGPDLGFQVGSRFFATISIRLAKSMVLLGHI